MWVLGGFFLGLPEPPFEPCCLGSSLKWQRWTKENTSPTGHWLPLRLLSKRDESRGPGQRWRGARAGALENHSDVGIACPSSSSRRQSVTSAVMDRRQHLPKHPFILAAEPQVTPITPDYISTKILQGLRGPDPVSSSFSSPSQEENQGQGM